MNKPFLYRGILVEPEELEALKFCINYCWHRASKHKHAPVFHLLTTINRWRKELNIKK